jgi:C4-dicarboxylate transporter DctM subunit
VIVVVLLFLGLVVVGVPVVVSLAVGSTVGILLTHTLPMAVVAAKTATAIDSSVLLAIPLFVLTGSLMTAGGIAQRLFELAKAVVGHFTGGLAQVNVAMSVFNAGLSGSSAADAAVDCKVIVPQMRAAGYPAEFSGAITAAGGILANIIPPSIAMLIYASLTNASVGDLFVAGIVPGLFLAGAISIVAYFTCRKYGYGPKGRRASFGTIVRSFRRSSLALLIPLVVVVGIRFGVFTATEAGAVAVVITFVLGTVVYRELRLADIPGVLVRSAIETGVIMLIISFAAPLAWLFAYSGVPQHLASVFSNVGGGSIVFLMVVNLFLLVGGALMEGVSLLILTTPILAPVAAALGVDPIQFGMIVIVNVVLGAITPPFGQVVFFVSSLTNVPSEKLFRHVARYLPALGIVLLVVTYIPATYMWTVRWFGP